MDCLKSAVIRPLIKELDDFVDTDVLKNYRPVSNLLFLEKLIELVLRDFFNKFEGKLEMEDKYRSLYSPWLVW